MKYYSGNNKPYIYALFHMDVEQKVAEILKSLNDKGILFWHSDKINKKELKRAEGAHAIIAFVTKEFVTTKQFHEVINTAVKENKEILTIFLEDVELDAWGHMQLDSAQYLNASSEDFGVKLSEASIFKNMRVTDKQKSFQRKSVITAIATPIIAAALIFSLVIYPLLLVPEIKTEEDDFGLAGLTQEELDAITSFYIAGDTIYKNVSSVHACYIEDRSSMSVEINDRGQRTYIYDVPKGTISDLSDLTKLRNLEELYICGQEITDLSPIYSLTKLRVLGVECNPISSLEGIGQLKNLEQLQLSGTDVEDLSPLNDLENLKGFWIDGTPVTTYPNTEILANLSNIVTGGTCNIPYMGVHDKEEFHIDMNSNPEIDDFSFLRDIKQFAGIITRNFYLSDILPYIEGKQISDLAFSDVYDLHSLSQLENVIVTGSLSLYYCSSLTTIAGIEKYDGLEKISLRQCLNVQDYYLLNNLKNVKYVYISSNMADLVLSQLNEDVCFEIVYEDD